MNTHHWGEQGVPFVAQQNTASGDARVEQQIGINFGETTFHRDGTYHIHQGDSPDRKQQVAINHLHGGNPRMAEQLFAELLRSGHNNSELAYCYGLSVLGDRSLGEIEPSVRASFRDACRAAKGFTGPWRDALGVVEQLMDCVWVQEDTGMPDEGGLRKALDDLEAMPTVRRAEIRRHLGMVLSGAIKDAMDKTDAQRVAVERTQPRRDQRAWMFFEPDPAAPRLFTAKPAEVPTEQQLAAWLGGAGVALGSLFVIVAIFSNAFFSAISALLLLSFGGYLAWDNALSQELVTRRRARREMEFGPSAPRPPVSPGHWVRTDFVRKVHELVDARFRDARPHIAGSWEQDTQGIRSYLKDRFVQLYGNARVDPEEINWIFRWYAGNTAQRWRSGVLFDFRSTLVTTSATINMCRAGLGLGAVGLIVLVAAQLVFPAILIGVGGYYAGRAAIGIVATRKREAEDRADYERLFAEEGRRFEEWKRVLVDRPNDEEMAQWLDLDKSHVKTLALRRCGLKNHDLVAHVVLTESAPKAMRARVIHGPPRYSAYVVFVFLLTSSGVREVEVDLNFLDGSIRDERRFSFSYESLASARVTEVGVRYAHDGRHIVRAGSVIAPVDGSVEVRSRAFQLSLVNSQDVTVVVENFDGLTDTDQEDRDALSRMALDTSGVATALHVLEAVAAEGRDWIIRESERRKQRSLDWRESDPERAEQPFPTFFVDAEGTIEEE